MTDQILTRAQARAQGLKRYFTGKPCKHGHVAERFIDGTCVPCRLARNARWAAENPEKKAASVRAFREKNADALKAKQKEYHAEWYAKNREAKLAQNKAYLRENRDVARKAVAKWRANNPEKAAEANRRWHEENPERRRENAKRKYHANPEQYKSRNRAWAAANPEAISARDARRRSREIEAPGTHTPADLKRILHAQGHRCPYCRCDLRKTKKHLDHIMPLALGGSNDRTNLQYLCAHCNLSKGAKDPIVFAQERGLLL